MKNARAAALLLLLAAIARGAAPAIDPPPGWRDAKDEIKTGGAVVALKGPESSSFIVKPAPGAPLDNPAGVRGYLGELLAGMRDASRKDYKASGRVETRVFRNGLSAEVLRAQLGGKDRLALALFAAGDAPYAAVLASAAPDAMLPSLLGGLRLGDAGGPAPASGAARSLDGQLELAVGGGLRARALLDSERAGGFVLAVEGAGSEVLFQKLAEEDAVKPDGQAEVVREMAAMIAGVSAAKASPSEAAPTAAGPVGVYSWAASAAHGKAAAGYLPWGYWGYQLFARGPAADDLLAGTLAAIKPGPRAVPGLLAATPRVPLQGRPGFLGLGLGAAALAAAGLAAWRLRRKNANLPT